MIPVPPQLQPPPPPVPVDFDIVGPRCAGSLIRGDTTIIGITALDGALHQTFDSAAFSAALGRLGSSPRSYFDAVFARLAERGHGLPQADQFHDARIMLHLLEEDPPEEFAPRARLSGHDDGLGSYQRAQVLQHLVPALLNRVQAEGLDTVYRDIELPVVDATVDMVANGVHVDTALLEGIVQSARDQADIARDQIVELAGRSINPDYDQALSHLIYDELGLPVHERSRSGRPSTSEQAFRPLVAAHPIVGAILRYRHHRSNVRSTQSLLDSTNPDTGRLHPRLDPLGAVTGRFTCSNPPLQCLPEHLLSAVTAEEGHVLIETDFSQIELRVLAHVAQDSGLLAAFQDEDVDLHAQTAAQILQIPATSVTPEQRQLGKAANFAMLYGAAAETIAPDVGMPLGAVRSFITAHHQTYSGVHAWIAGTQFQAISDRHTRTAFGRRRFCDDNRAGMRQAVNSVVQGTAADLLKLALGRLHAALPPECRMLLTVHDSVLVECPEHRADEVSALMKETMEAQPPQFTVPLRVDVGIGRTWAECKQRASTACVANPNPHIMELANV